MSQPATIAGPDTQPGFFETLRKDYFFWVLLAVLVLLTVFEPYAIQRYPKLVDWPTIAALTGLLILTKGVEMSGYLDRLALRMAAHMPTARALGLFLVLTSALLSTVLTNDIALFIVVPLTLSLRLLAPLPIARLIVFEALAVNAGSALTPIGNPQNLFLWHLSGTSFLQFTLQMLPLVAVLMILLLLLTAFAFSGRAIQLRAARPAVETRWRLMIVSLALYLPFLLLINLRMPLAALLPVLAVYLFAYRRVLGKVDWGLIAIFILMFIDLRLLADLSLVRDTMQLADLGQTRDLFLVSAIGSQFISNVPAAILLAEYSADWKTIAYGVNVGGFGFAVGSLANLIALRMASGEKIWRLFHIFSIPFFVVTASAVYALLISPD